MHFILIMHSKSRKNDVFIESVFAITLIVAKYGSLSYLNNASTLYKKTRRYRPHFSSHL